MIKNRYLYEKIRSDLEKYRKIAFICGPRQVGKTTLAWQLLGPDADETHPGYLNWDTDHDRQRILAGDFPADQPLIVLDEIHKFSDWRQLLKGLWDKNKSRKLYVVTGSARLDHYRHGGDSLMGRYFFYRLHPLTPNEIDGIENTDQRLLNFSGFPEPFSYGDKEFLARWQNLRRKRVVEEDLIDLEHVIEIKKLSLMMSLLPNRVGSLLSLRSLGEDLKISHSTAERWITILENLYYCYRISPWGSGELQKALKKDQKLFLWDWSSVTQHGPRFENMVGSALLKYIHLQEDLHGENLRLHFLRDKEKREIDFLVCDEDGQPRFAVECKYGNQKLAPHLKYFSERTSIPQYYQVHLESANSRELLDGKVIILSFHTLCRKLGV